MFPHVCLYTAPIALIVADSLAIGADGQESPEGPDVPKSLPELRD
jgi:hypothetical protein